MLVKTLILMVIAAITAVLTVLVEIPKEAIFVVLILGIVIAYVGTVIDNKKDGNKKLASNLVILGGLGTWVIVVTYTIVTRILQ